MTMRAVVAPVAGGPEVLEFVERPVPEPADDEVLIRVAATALNRPDILQRQGRYPPPRGASDVLGLEASGTVAAVGADVDHPAVGDEVCVLLAAGGYAEYVVAPAAACLPVPVGVDVVTAAAIPEVFTTAYDNLLTRGRLRDGETLLVHGGASGVGTAAIQIARRAGARVLATAGSAPKLDACRRLGAQEAFDYHADWAAAVREHVGGREVDVVLDIIGGAYLDANLGLLAREGRLVVIGLQGGAEATLDLRRLLARHLTVTASLLRPRSGEEKAALAETMRREVLPGFVDGSLRPVVDRVVAFDDVADAHAAMEASEHIGKIVVRVAPVTPPAPA